MTGRTEFERVPGKWRAPGIDAEESWAVRLENYREYGAGPTGSCVSQQLHEPSACWEANLGSERKVKLSRFFTDAEVGYVPVS